MRKPILLAMACLGVALLASWTASAPAEPRIRVLLTYGGHDFQEKEFFAMWDNMPGVSYTKARLPESADLFKPGLEKQYDVIVAYDMVKELSPTQQQGLLDVLKRGMGLVALHHNLSGNLEWPEYHEVIGGSWLWQKRTVNGREYGPSTYEHGQEIPVKIADPVHPITRGLKDFVIHDETYGNTYVSTQVHVLLTADNPRNVGPFAWTNHYGDARIVYFQAGHDSDAWKHPAFHEILSRSMRWAAKAD